MLNFQDCNNITVDGDEFTSGFLGLDWFPSADSSANRRRYEYDVIITLRRIIQTFAGWSVINEVFYLRPRTMRILPYHPTPVTGQFNATATPTDLAAATMKDTTALDRQGKIPGPGQPRTIGSGKGSDTIINCSPSVFAGASGAPTGPGALGDEILLHEMVHGLRQMMGRSVRESVGGNPGMDNYEEFVAITIANVYRSEVGAPQLRQDHHGFLPLTGPTTNPAVFANTYAQYLNYMDIEMPRLCKNLREASCAFNPLR